MSVKFKVVASPLVPAAVQLTLHGNAEPVTVEVIYRHKTVAQYDAWRERAAAEKRPMLDQLLDVIEDMPGLVDEHDTPVKFGRESLDQLLENYGSAGAELARGYRIALFESRAKN